MARELISRSLSSRSLQRLRSLEMLKVIHRSGPTETQGVFAGAFVASAFAVKLVYTS